MKSETFEILTKYPYIKDIQFVGNRFPTVEQLFQLCFSFSAEIEGYSVLLGLGIPKDWDRELLSFFVLDTSQIPIIPHLERSGKLCLFDLEGVIIDSNFPGILRQSVERMYTVVSEGLLGKNRSDFISEFESYWVNLPNIKIADVYITASDCTESILVKKKQVNRRKRKKDTYAAIINQKANYSYSVSDDEKIVPFRSLNIPSKRGLYIPIISDEFIFPPDWRTPLSTDYISMLFDKASIEPATIRKELNKTISEIVVIFRITQPDETVCFIGTELKNALFTKEKKTICLSRISDAIPLAVSLHNRDYLFMRGSSGSELSFSNILLIGCGSIGGYLCEQLVKLGVKQLMLVDNDKLRPENVYRHFLGLEYANHNKADALHEYFAKNLPYVRINTRDYIIQEQIEDGGIEFTDYDFIISATGNHNVNLWINTYILQNAIDIPVLYLWNEVLGIGHHALLVSSRNSGCYNCLIRRDENGELYDASSFCDKNQLFSHQHRGCGTRYIPYSASTSQKTVQLGISLMSTYSHNSEENTLLSLKGDERPFISAGYRLSSRYSSNTSQLIRLTGDQFYDNRCTNHQK